MQRGRKSSITSATKKTAAAGSRVVETADEKLVKRMDYIRKQGLIGRFVQYSEKLNKKGVMEVQISGPTDPKTLAGAENRWKSGGKKYQPDYIFVITDENLVSGISGRESILEKKMPEGTKIDDFRVLDIENTKAGGEEEEFYAATLDRINKMRKPKGSGKKEVLPDPFIYSAAIAAETADKSGKTQFLVITKPTGEVKTKATKGTGGGRAQNVYSRYVATRSAGRVFKFSADKKGEYSFGSHEQPVGAGRDYWATAELPTLTSSDADSKAYNEALDRLIAGAHLLPSTPEIEADIQAFQAARGSHTSTRRPAGAEKSTTLTSLSKGPARRARA